MFTLLHSLIPSVKQLANLNVFIFDNNTDKIAHIYISTYSDLIVFFWLWFELEVLPITHRYLYCTILLELCFVCFVCGCKLIVDGWRLLSSLTYFIFAVDMTVDPTSLPPPWSHNVSAAAAVQLFPITLHCCKLIITITIKPSPSLLLIILGNGNPTLSVWVAAVPWLPYLSQNSFRTDLELEGLPNSTFELNGRLL